MKSFHAALREIHSALGRTHAVSDRLARRVLLLVGRGRTSTPADDSGSIQTAQVQINDLETIDNLKRVAEFGFSSSPPVGTDVAIVFVGGDRSSGLIVGTNHKASRPKGLQPGETVIFTADGKQIYLTASDGIKVAANGQPVEVDNASTVTVNATTEIIANTQLFKCSGDILDNYETNTRTVAEMRQVANGHTHKVPNVQAGTSTVETDPPDQDE